MVASDIRPGGYGFSDAARRVADAVQGHLARSGASAYFRWISVALADGRSDGVLYDRRAEAHRHQPSPERCAYIQIPPTGMNPREAEAVLRWARFAYDNGYRMPDPETPEPIMPLRREALSPILRSPRYASN